jgi:Replication-relaxation
MTKKYRNPRVRQKPASGRGIQPRDLDVIEAVLRFRVLSQKQIQLLFFGSRETAKYRLQFLFDGRYLDRKFLPPTQGMGRSPTLYILDRRGLEELRRERGFDDVRWHGTSKQVTPFFLEHTLAINEVMVALTLACRHYGFEIETWKTENEIKADYDRVSVKLPSGKRGDVPILPDAIFSFVAYNQRNRCLLELDRGMEKTDVFRQKVRAYIAYFENGSYEARYQTTAGRVLTVISGRYSGEKRLENLKRVTEEVGGKKRFWFATAKNISPETILFSPIWQLATETEPRELVKPLQDAPAD